MRACDQDGPIPRQDVLSNTARGCSRVRKLTIGNTQVLEPIDVPDSVMARSETVFPSSSSGTLMPTSGATRSLFGLLGSGGWSFIVATAGLNGFNLLFHIAISRLLGPSYYGALGSLLHLVTVLSVPLGAVQLAVTQAMVSSSKSGDKSLRALTIGASLWGMGAMAVFWALSPLLMSFLHLETVTPLLLLGAWIPIAAVGAALQGALMGQLRFLPTAVSTFVGGGLLRLVVGVGLVVAGLGIDGAIAATVLGQAFTTAALLFAARSLLGDCARQQLRISLRDAVLSIVALSGYTLLLGIDTPFAQHFLPRVQAGTYAAAATGGHIAMFLPGALTMIAFPRLASDGGIGRQSRRMVVRTMGLIVALSAVAVLVLAGMSALVVRTLFGSSYLPAASILGVLALTSGIFALVGLLVYIQIARHSWAAFVCWGGVVAFSIVVSVLHPDFHLIAFTLLGTSVGVFAILLWQTVHGFVVAGEFSRDTRSPVATVSPLADIDMTVVVPFYNPGKALVRHVEDVVSILEHERISFEVIAVSDGSTDGSQDALFGLSSVRLVELPTNQGKGAALRVGLSQGRGKYLGFIDGDGDIPASQLHSFIEEIRTSTPDFVLGSKLHHGSQVVYPFMRRLYSVGYQRLTWLLFGLPVRDTQTGIKLIRRDVLAAILPRTRETGFAFDLELLVVANRLGLSDFSELPVTIRKRFTSTISCKTAFRMLFDTAVIFCRHRTLRPERLARTLPPELCLSLHESPGHADEPTLLPLRSDL